MAFSKIILNGTTLMDLTSDTVAETNLISPNTAHDAAGLPVTGTATAGITPTGTVNISTNGTHDVTQYASAAVAVPTGVDLPVFTLTYNEVQDEYSVTCNKTFAECMALLSNTAYGAILTEYGSSTYILTGIADNNNRIWYASYTGEDIGYDIIYYSNGSIEYVNPSSLSLTLNATSNGTYTADDEGRFGVYTEVNVNVPTPTPTLQSKTATPTESAQTITADSGYDGLSGVEVGAISSTYVGSGIDRRSSSDLAESGATVTVPAGYYESSASKAVASGTAGTPTATKGTVSNHSISVTPSVTNTTGYITGGTVNGTSVTVTASELVSGTLTIDSSGTKDVTNYASASVPAGTAGTPSATKGTVSNHQVSVTPSVTNTTGWITGGTKSGTAVTVTASELASGNKAITDNGTNIDVVGYSTVSVAVPFSTIYSGSSDPSSSTGSNGDVYIKTAS